MHKETYTNNPSKKPREFPMGKLCIDLACPNLPFAEHILIGFFFFYGVLKNRKLVKEFSIALKNKKRLGRFVLRVLKIKSGLIFLL